MLVYENIPTGSELYSHVAEICIATDHMSSNDLQDFRLLSLTFYIIKIRDWFTQIRVASSL